MPFDAQFRYLAFSSDVLQSAALLRDAFGALASLAPMRNGQMVKTLVCGLDNTATGALRAGVLGETIIPILLNDGRYVVGGYWSLAVLAEMDAGNIHGEELTEAQVRALLPQQTL